MATEPQTLPEKISTNDHSPATLDTIHTMAEKLRTKILTFKKVDAEPEVEKLEQSILTLGHLLAKRANDLAGIKFTHARQEWEQRWADVQEEKLTLTDKTVRQATLDFQAHSLMLQNTYNAGQPFAPLGMDDVVPYDELHHNTMLLFTKLDKSK